MALSEAEQKTLVLMQDIGNMTLNEVKELLRKNNITSDTLGPIYTALDETLDTLKDKGDLTHGVAIGAALFLLMAELTQMLAPKDLLDQLPRKASATEPRPVN
jgi:hypothetical protein